MSQYFRYVSPEFYARCSSKFQAKSHQFYIPSLVTYDQLTNYYVPCCTCTEPDPPDKINDFLCCCSCYEFEWPGLAVGTCGSVADLPMAGARTISLAITNPCNVYAGPGDCCFWYDNTWNVETSPGYFFPWASATLMACRDNYGYLQWTLTVSIVPCNDPSHSITAVYTADSRDGFDCTGGDVELQSVSSSIGCTPDVPDTITITQSETCDGSVPDGIDTNWRPSMIHLTDFLISGEPNSIWNETVPPPVNNITWNFSAITISDPAIFNSGIKMYDPASFTWVANTDAYTIDGNNSLTAIDCPYITTNGYDGFRPHAITYFGQPDPIARPAAWIAMQYWEIRTTIQWDCATGWTITILVKQNSSQNQTGNGFVTSFYTGTSPLERHGTVTCTAAPSYSNICPSLTPYPLVFNYSYDE